MLLAITFAEAATGIANDLQIRGGIAAHRRESGIANAVAAHDHIVGAKDVDGVAPLAGSAGFVHHAFDAVVDDQGAVVARRAAPNQDAAIAGSANRIAGNLQPARIDRENGGIAAIDRVGCDFAIDGLKRNAVAPGIEDLAIGDADRAALRHMQQPAAFRQRNSCTVKNDAGDSHMIAAGGRHHRRASRHHDAGRAGNTFDRGIRRQLQRARAIETRRQSQDRTRRGGLLDGALKDLRLIVGRVRVQPKRDGIKLGPRRGISRRCGAHIGRGADCA
jgi:hypothetical protein